MKDDCFCSVDKAVIIRVVSALALGLIAVSDKVNSRTRVF